MANSRIPGPLGRNVQLGDTLRKSSCDFECRRGHRPGPIRVADAPSKKTPKAPAPVVKIIFHIYETLLKPTPGGIPEGFTKQDFMNWFNAPDDTRVPDGPGKWDTAGDFKVEYNFNPKTGVKDFEASLQTKGAFVVYVGHSTLTATPKGQPEGPSLGLSPENPKKGPEIPNDRLRTLLSKST